MNRDIIALFMIPSDTKAHIEAGASLVQGYISLLCGTLSLSL